jgi:hypothetical protein
MHEFLSGTWEPLLAYTRHEPLRALVGVLVVAQLAILAFLLMFGKGKWGADSGDISGWDFGDGDGGGD